MEEILKKDCTKALIQDDQIVRSEELEEELLDYDEDYELTEQEKAELDFYEKEMAEQEARAKSTNGVAGEET